MASGSVIRYGGKRGVVWRLKYTDATGKQTMEAVGAERDGWTERRAREALADRLSDVRRHGYRNPQRSRSAPKTEDGIRSIALSSRLVEALAEQWQRTPFRGDDEVVFCHQSKGSRLTAKSFAEALRAAMRAAGVDAATRSGRST